MTNFALRHILLYLKIDFFPVASWRKLFGRIYFFIGSSCIWIILRAFHHLFLFLWDLSLHESILSLI